ncbi:hypothetical protein [Winogradskyella flava]|uniref:hypothetical protein n=1 Tax=Winogradskyella flava TaxID=1884876 RepID=UPI002491AD96|nr:hypothetical protein [Winogradskyella flava]
MKKIFFTLLFFGCCFLISAQTEPKVGDELIIEAQDGPTYHHIKFPKLNILVKRGKVANYKSVHGNVVIIDDVITDKDNNTYVVLKKKDGSKFFGFLTKVKANYEKSIASGEMVVKS